MWRPQQFQTHPGVGAPRDYVHDWAQAIDATMSPIKYLLERNAQNQQATHENNQDFTAAINSQSQAKRADAYLALEQARSEHYNQTDSARLALEQAQEQRAKEQAIAEEAMLPLKRAYTQSQIANLNAETNAKITTLQNQTNDSLLLGKFFKDLNSMSNDDILDGKAGELLSGLDLKEQSAITRAQQMLQERQDRGAMGTMLKQQGGWNSDEWQTFNQLQKPKDQGGQGMSATQAFGTANQYYQQRVGKVSQQAQEEQNKQDIDQYSFNNLLANASAKYGINPKTLDNFDADTGVQVGNARNLASAWQILHKQDPTKDAFYQANPDAALKDAGFQAATPRANTPGQNANSPQATTTSQALTDRFFKNYQQPQNPGQSTLNPAGVQNPTQQPAPDTGIQTPQIMPGSTTSIDDQTLNTLGAIHAWRSNQLSALGGGDNDAAGEQLASIENSQGGANG